MEIAATGVSPGCAARLTIGTALAITDREGAKSPAPSPAPVAPPPAPCIVLPPTGPTAASHRTYITDPSHCISAGREAAHH